MNSSITPHENERTCPYLGTSDDPQTSMAYPSGNNYCHRVKSLASPSLAYQRSYCMNAAHVQCEAYTGSQLKTLPLEAVDAQAALPGIRPLLKYILPAIFVLLALVVTWFALKNNPAVVIEPKLTATITAQLPAVVTKAVTQTAVSSQTVEPSQTPIQATATSTVVPATSTAVPPHLIETPVGLTRQFIVHQVREGESTTSLAKKYGTTEQAIRAVNYLMTGSLWANSILVIPLNQVDVSLVPPLSAYAITKQGVNLDALALEQGVDKLLLAEINALPADYIFTIGEWVLIPHPRSTP
jgi:LysM repeat protein